MSSWPRCAPTRLASARDARQPVGFMQPLQLVAELSQQVFPPRNVGVGFDTQRRGAIHHAEHAAAQLRLRDDHLCRVGRRAIDAADLRHRAHSSQHVDGKKSPRKIRKVWPAPMANALSRARARAASSLPDQRTSRLPEASQKASPKRMPGTAPTSASWRSSTVLMKCDWSKMKLAASGLTMGTTVSSMAALLQGGQRNPW